MILYTTYDILAIKWFKLDNTNNKLRIHICFIIIKY